MNILKVHGIRCCRFELTLGSQALGYVSAFVIALFLGVACSSEMSPKEATETLCASDPDFLPLTPRDSTIEVTGAKADLPPGELWCPFYRQFEIAGNEQVTLYRLPSVKPEPHHTILAELEWTDLTDLMLALPELQALPANELLQRIVPSLVQLQAGAEDPTRFTIQSVDVGGVPETLANCLRVAASALDRGAPSAEGELLILDVTGRYCIHPDDKRMLIGVLYSERKREASKPAADLESEGEHFLQSLSFTQLPTPTGHLAFSSNRDEESNYEIYTVDVESGTVVRLTESPGFDGAPSWSPDGTRIAFQSGRSDQQEIFVMDADGSAAQQLTASGPNFCPAWSPDGNAVAFHSTRDGNEEIYIKSLDTGEEKRLTDSPAHDTCPSWSPDGIQLVFTSRADQAAARGMLLVMNADGSGPHQFTEEPWATSPAWSPTGHEIAYRCRSGVCRKGLSDELEVSILSFFGVPAWSSDARFLAVLQRPSSLSIYSPEGVRLQDVPLPQPDVELPQIHDDRLSWTP
jgi:hypothetical protein